MLIRSLFKDDKFVARKTLLKLNEYFKIMSYRRAISCPVETDYAFLRFMYHFLN